MARIEEGSPGARSIDAALAAWHQGDVALEETSFTHLADPEQALTAAAAQGGSGLHAITSEVDGLVVVTQTCDIRRPCTLRQFVEVAPLVRVPQDELWQIKKERLLRYAYVPCLEGRLLVADLDRMMTVEKAVVAGWRRTPGCRTDDERREFAQALARRRQRFAFPDDFVDLLRPLQSRMKRKHDRNSPEGRLMRALDEIRVSVAPTWESAENVRIMFWFIRDEATVIEDSLREKYRGSWLALVPASGRFESVEGVVTTLDDLTARDYVESARLDLDHLSTSGA